MATQALEQMLDSVPVRLQERAYQTLDMQVGPAAMYCQWNPFCNCPNGRQTPDVMDQMFGTPARDTTLGDPGMGSRQTTLNEYTIPEPPKLGPILPPEPQISIQPYQRGMVLDGGLNLYGNQNSAILYDPSTNVSIHHHNLGGGIVKTDQDPIIKLPWNLNLNK